MSEQQKFDECFRAEPDYKVLKKKILSKMNDTKFSYKLECNGIYHYFTGETIKEVNVGKCWCKK